MNCLISLKTIHYISKMWDEGEMKKELCVNAGRGGAEWCAKVLVQCMATKEWGKATVLDKKKGGEGNIACETKKGGEGS
jgi:hypothetical protein